MLFSLLRSPKCRQVGQIELNISVNGTAGTPVASGPDAAFIQSITDNGTGDYTITLKEAAKLPLHVAGLVLVTTDASATVFAVTTSTIQVRFRSVAAVPAAKDADFNIHIKYMDQLSYYF